MPYLNDFYDGLRSAILTTSVWDDCQTGGVWEAEHLEMVAWEDLKPPYAVMHISTMQRGKQWGVSNLAYEFPVRIFYVAAISGPSSNIRTKLETLRDFLRVTPLTKGEVRDIPMLTWSNDVYPNNIFIAKNTPYRAGILTADCIIGEVL